MASRLIATKLYAPTVPRRGLVVRPRLLECLDRGADARLTLVSAPAGFGKTTLLAAWLGERPGDQHGVAWLSLDPTDDEPVSFWTYVVAALQGAEPRLGLNALELVASSAVPIESVLTTLVNELAAAPDEVWLILDDYHLVSNQGIRGGMAFLLDHLPAQVHVVLVTRADPDLPLARWRARGELVEIRAADLRFTSAEAGAYLDAALGVALGAADVAILDERTEGWIAALQLAALSLRGRTDVSGFIAQFAGDDRYIVDYLADEVLRHQPEAIREFLLQTAILDRLTGLLCNAVTGRDDGGEMLATLERANLFTVPLDDRRQWYRYHHLFVDVLRARLLSERPQQVPLLHQRASQWYESQDQTDEAIEHALAGQDFPRTGRLMELAVPAIRRSRRDGTMYGWLRALPDDTVRRSPVLDVFYGSMLMGSGDSAGAEARFGAVERTLADLSEGQILAWADTPELRTLPATIAVYRASIAYARGDVGATLQHARRALDLTGPSDHLARGGAAGFLGLAAWSQGDVVTAVETFSEAVASLSAAGTRTDELTSTVLLADLWLVAGRPSEARQLYEQALERAQAWGAPVARASAELQVGLSEQDVETGDFDSARRRLDSASVLDHRAAMTGRGYRWFVARALLADAEGEPAQAVDLLGQAARLDRPGFLPDVRPVPAMKARFLIAQGRLSEAAAWARDRGLADADVSYLNEYEHLTWVRLLLAQHRETPGVAAGAEAGQLLARLYDAARTSGRDGSLLEIRMLQALALDAQDERLQAMETLAGAFALAPELDGYVRLFLNENEPMLSLLRAMKLRGVGGHHPDRLLTLSAGSESAGTGRGQRRASAAIDSLSGRELQVLRMLDGELTAPEIAHALFVSHNTVRTHTKHIFTKLDVNSRRAAVQRARERGLL